MIGRATMLNRHDTNISTKLNQWQVYFMTNPGTDSLTPTLLQLTQYFINLGPLVLKATSLWFFIHSFIDNGVDRTRPASNGLNPAQVPF